MTPVPLTTGSDPLAQREQGRLDAETGTWMALWTKPRQEKAVGRYLDATGATFYLPLVEKVTKVNGRRLRSHLPLFPGYVFLAGSREDGYAAIATKRVCSVLEIADQDGFVGEIEQIRLALSWDGALDPYPFAVAGRRCRVRRGPFAGIEGVITERLGIHRLVLQLSILGQGAALEIDTDDLEPAD